MTSARFAPARRRPPAPADRYRAIARAAKQRRSRRKLSPALTGLVWGAVLASAALVFDTTAGGMTALFGSAGNLVSSVIPAPVPVGDITISEARGQVGAAPTLDALPQFTKEPALVVQGLIPSFVRAADRKVAISVNGAAETVVPFDANGHFALPLTLNEGTNQIVVALVAGKDTIASTSTSVVLDRTAPPLAVSKPKDKDTVDGPNVTVEGKAEPGATVLVNDRTVIVGQDGSFSDTVTVQPGELPITVVARDRAGNETKSKLGVTVKPAASPSVATTTVTVVLTNATVKPGGFVTANINVLSGAAPVTGLRASLQVGVIPIGSAVTDAAGHAAISFFAPPNEGIAQVVVLAGSAVLTVAK
jgi:hypothetical protein